MVEQASQDGSVVSMGSLCMEWLFWDRIDFGQPQTLACSTRSLPAGCGKMEEWTCGWR